MENDASGVGPGAILAQLLKNGMVHSITYASRTLQLHKELCYHGTRGTRYRVGNKLFYHYLYRHDCEVYTNHKPLTALLNALRLPDKLARWGLILQDVDLIILYCSGNKNTGADVLSHLPVDQDIMMVPPYQRSRIMTVKYLLLQQ